MSDQACDTYWNSHGCDLPRGHDGEHLCGLDDGDDGPHAKAWTDAEHRSWSAGWIDEDLWSEPMRSLLYGGDVPDDQLEPDEGGPRGEVSS